MKGHDGANVNFTNIDGSPISSTAKSLNGIAPPYHQKNFYGQTMNWAGGLHYRSNFNKTKDYLGDWTNVFFRN
jgi:hypothetical protein